MCNINYIFLFDVLRQNILMSDWLVAVPSVKDNWKSRINMASGVQFVAKDSVETRLMLFVK